MPLMKLPSDWDYRAAIIFRERGHENNARDNINRCWAERKTLGPGKHYAERMLSIADIKCLGWAQPAGKINH